MAEKNMNAKISVEFEETANRQQLSSGDNLPTLFGKIKKFFTDLKPVAMSGSYNDLDDKPVVDEVLDVNSENPIQNKVVAEALQNVDAVSLGGYHRNSMIITYGYCVNSDGSHKDLNELNYPGSWLAFNDSPNAPPNATGWGTVLVYTGGTGSIVQLWVDYNGILSFIRSFDGNNWSAWKNDADGGNADTLDGLHADSFVPRLRTVPLDDAFTQEKGVNCSGDSLGVYREYARKSADGKTVQKYFRVYGPDGVKYTDLRVTATEEGASWAIAGSGYTGIPFLVGGNSVLTTASAAATATAKGLMDSTDKAKLDNTNVAYGTCATAAATAAKTVTITGNTNWKLAVGSEVIVKFTNTNTASNCTLNVNNTGAKQVWYNTAVNTGNSSTIFGYANRYIKFMYDGTYWVWMGMSLDANTWTAASATANGYVSTETQTFAGAKTFNGVVKVAGATDATVSQVRNIAVGTTEATTSNCPVGALYGQYS